MELDLKNELEIQTNAPMSRIKDRSPVTNTRRVTLGSDALIHVEKKSSPHEDFVKFAVFQAGIRETFAENLLAHFERKTEVSCRR